MTKCTILFFSLTVSGEFNTKIGRFWFLELFWGLAWDENDGGMRAQKNSTVYWKASRWEKKLAVEAPAECETPSFCRVRRVLRALIPLHKDGTRTLRGLGHQLPPQGQGLLVHITDRWIILGNKGKHRPFLWFVMHFSVSSDIYIKEKLRNFLRVKKLVKHQCKTFALFFAWNDEGM